MTPTNEQLEVLRRMADGEPLDWVGWVVKPKGLSGDYYELPYNPVREPRFHVSRNEVEEMQRAGWLDGALLTESGRKLAEGE